MLSAICFAAVFAVEIAISVYYFNSVFQRKSNNLVFWLSLLGYFTISYGCVLLHISLLNLISFVLCNSLLVIINYKFKVKSLLFHVLILLIVNVITEDAIYYAVYGLFGLDIDQCLETDALLYIEASITKLFYFLVVFVLRKVVSREEHKDKISNTLVLCILPISSIIVLQSLITLCMNTKVSSSASIMLSCGSLLLLISDIIVFYVYEFTLKTQRKNATLEFEKQKEKSNREYYTLLAEQNNRSKILIHDIKKHFINIKALSEKNDTKDIYEYIDSISEDFMINDTVEYTSNTLLNVIINRYKEKCKKSNIKLDIDIQTPSLDYISNPDITSLFDNLFENAYEASVDSKDKHISMSIVRKNENFIIINFENSYLNNPVMKKNSYISQKKDYEYHGSGIKSIERVVEKYKGNITMQHNNSKKLFKTTVVLKVI